jgi:hypothetical protein
MDKRLTNDEIWDMYANQADVELLAAQSVEQIKNDLREIDPALSDDLAKVYSGVIHAMAIQMAGRK